VIPFARKLRFPSETLRARRDHKKYLGLIPDGGVCAPASAASGKGDRCGGRAGGIRRGAPVGRGLRQPPGRRGFRQNSRRHLAAGGGRCSARSRLCARNKRKAKCWTSTPSNAATLRRVSRWSETQLRQYLGELEQHELVEPVIGRQGKEYLYHLAYDEEGRALSLDLSTEQELFVRDCLWRGMVILRGLRGTSRKGPAKCKCAQGLGLPPHLSRIWGRHIRGPLQTKKVVIRHDRRLANVMASVAGWRRARSRRPRRRSI